jgi:hypothetical protein
VPLKSQIKKEMTKIIAIMKMIIIMGYKCKRGLSGENK